jgi:hypothetical protein
VKCHSFSHVASSTRAPLHLTRILDLGRYCPLRIIRRSKIASGSGKMVDESDTKGRWGGGCVTCP